MNSSFGRLRSNRTSHGRKTNKRQLRCETLEDRRLLATFTVINTADAGAGSLRQAIIDSNALAGADIIDFAPAVQGQTISLTTQMQAASTTGLLITDSVTIDASAGARVTIAGNNAFRVFKIDDGTTTDKVVEFKNLKITGGNANNETWTSNFLNRRGGGVDNREAFTLRNCEISGNSGRRGGGLSSSGNGDNARRGSLTVIDSIISGNTAQNDQIGTTNTSGGRGGGIAVYNSSPVTIRNSMIQNNTAASLSAAVDVSLGVTMTITDTTMTGNASADRGTAMYISQFGDTVNPVTNVTLDNVNISGNTTGMLNRDATVGILWVGQGASLTVQNSMITNNVAISESVQFFEGMVGGQSAGTIFNMRDTVISGNMASDNLVAIGFGVTGTLTNVDIVNNSMISVGGAYYDANTGTPLTVTAYGSSLLIEDSTISGNSAATPFFSDGSVNVGNGANLIVRRTDITNNANLGGLRAIAGTYLTSALVQNSTISGNSLSGVTGDIYSGAAYGADIEIVDSIISNNATDPVNAIGGVYLRASVGYETGSRFQLTRSTIAGNSNAGGAGGGIHANNFTGINIVDSTIDGNSANTDGTYLGAGGGISLVDSTATITRSTISSNAATAGDAGGVFFYSSTSYPRSLTISNSTISGNSTAGTGGGIWAATLYATSTVTIDSSTITLNTAQTGGGGIYAYGYAATTLLTMNNTIASGNIDTSATSPDVFDLGSYVGGTFNFIGNNAGSSFASPGVNGNKVGTPGAPLNAMLGALALNGGMTRNHLPMAGSQVIDMGDPATMGGTDQRGLNRVVGGRVDIGSVEVQAAAFNLDFNNDSMYDCADMDLLEAAIDSGTFNPAFDVNGDLALTSADVFAWLMDAGEARFGAGRFFKNGDANLDGVVDGQDFIVWNTNKFTNARRWCQGDFNQDNVVDGQDFIIWNSNKFTSSDAARPAGLNSSVVPRAERSTRSEAGRTARSMGMMELAEDTHAHVAKAPKAAPTAWQVEATGRLGAVREVAAVPPLDMARGQNTPLSSDFIAQEKDEIRSHGARKATLTDQAFSELDQLQSVVLSHRSVDTKSR